MNLRVERFDPEPPPIQKVVIELNPIEAANLVELFGRLSRANVREVLDYPGKGFNAKKDDKVENIYLLTAGIYVKMQEEEAND